MEYSIVHLEDGLGNLNRRKHVRENNISDIPTSITRDLNERMMFGLSGASFISISPQMPLVNFMDW